MRKYLWYIIALNLIVALMNSTVRGNEDCMDNSKHLDRRTGPDFKKYHYVGCTCPCTQYAQLFNRGRCERCWHYRAPQPLEIVRYDPKACYHSKKASCAERGCSASTK